jgi:hypothetical protein
MSAAAAVVVLRKAVGTCCGRTPTCWEQGSFALGVTVAKVKFPNGQIDSTQWGLVLDTATDFNFVPAGRLDAPARASGGTGIGFDRFQIVETLYRPRSGGAVPADGLDAPRDIHTIGVRAEQA